MHENANTRLGQRSHGHNKRTYRKIRLVAKRIGVTGYKYEETNELNDLKEIRNLTENIKEAFYHDYKAE